MIGRLEGRLHQARPGEVVIDAGGVGYLVSTTLRAYQTLARAERACLWVHTQVRSDAIVLFGFLERPELEAFQRLIAVAGVGPRIALAVLTAMTPDELAEAVEAGDAARLQRTPGVGRKTAERILLELEGRLARGGAAAPNLGADAVSALVNLGYAQREAQRAIDEAVDGATGGDLGELIRLALQRLSR
jgi:holliday junction DNA helicase RuvA